MRWCSRPGKGDTVFETGFVLPVHVNGMWTKECNRSPARSDETTG